MASTEKPANENFLNTERQFSLGIINDAFGLGYHCWWILGFILSFGLFTVMLAFVGGVFDVNGGTSGKCGQSPENLNMFMRNLGESNIQTTVDTLERLSRLEGAEKAFNYPLLYNAG